MPPAEVQQLISEDLKEPDLKELLRTTDEAQQLISEDLKATLEKLVENVKEQEQLIEMNSTRLLSAPLLSSSQQDVLTRALAATTAPHRSQNSFNISTPQLWGVEQTGTSPYSVTYLTLILK